MSRRVLPGLAALFLVIFIYDGILVPAAAPSVRLPPLAGGLNAVTLVMLLFSLVHAAYAIGWRHTSVFFATSAVISWVYEESGVATGAIYGPYHYSGLLGGKLGHVPMLIPLAWFMMIYPSYVIANLIADGEPTGSRGTAGRVAWLALLSATVMTSWDLVVDPLLSGPNVRAWVWEEGGPYFGVPIRNYAGWLVTTLTVYLIYRLYERRVPARPVGPVTTPVAALPVIAYAAVLLSNLVSVNAPPALLVIGPFVMGGPFLFALDRLSRRP